MQFFCIFLSPLLNIFCFCQVHTISILYCTHLCMKCYLGSLIFLKRSLVFPILLFSSMSLHCSLRKALLSLLAILWNSAFKWVYLSFSLLSFPFLLFSANYKASSDNYFAFFFLEDNFDHCLLYNIMSLHPHFFSHSVRSNRLNLFVSSTI